MRFVVLIAALFAAAPAAALTVRVDSAGGAPRLVVNGKPVRARMFWGGPGSAPLSAGPEGRVVSFEFAAVEDEPRAATLHFRFGRTPGDVYLDEISVTDLESGVDLFPTARFEGGMADFERQWTFWPTGPQNTVGSIEVAEGAGYNGSRALHLSLKAPADGKWPDFHIHHQPRLALVKDRRYRVSFWVRAEPARALNVAFYRPGQAFTFLGGPGGHLEAQVRMAAGAGADFVSFPIAMPWPRPGEAVDWKPVDAACRQVLQANPRALLIPRMWVDPPAWWCEAHPDEVMCWEDGSRGHRAVVASPRYRREAAARLADLVAHLEEAFPENIAGYHPCGQNTGEWFYEQTWKPLLSGYAPADRDGFRRWLKRRYPNDAALRRAWCNPKVTRNTAEVPSAAERHAAPAGVLRDPTRERALIDFAAYQQEAMADCVCELARAARRASRGRKLVVFFYGYGFEFGKVETGPAVSGHYAFRRVLSSPDIDVLCSPISYFDRSLGGSAPAMSAAESVALAGKMWLHEDDTATYLSTGTPSGGMKRAKNLEETNALLVRNVAQVALRNFGTWWMDLRQTGWFNDQGMWNEMARLRTLDEAMLANPTPFKPDIAAVLDEASMLLVAQNGHTVTQPGIYEVRRSLALSGAPYGQYLLDDVLAGRVRARLYVFLNAWSLSGEQRRKLLEATRGAACVWCYAPGYLDGSQPSPAAMRELTGFNLQPAAVPRAWAVPTDAGRRRGLVTEFGVQKEVIPLFKAADAAPEETLAAWPEGSAAVALRRGRDGVSLFVGAPGLTPELVRLAAREAGVHLFTETDCNVYANGPFVALHAPVEGPVTLDTGSEGPVRDLLTGERVGEGPRLTLLLQRGETRVLCYAPVSAP
ncbi:MAG: beta-galactosidase [Armatimonadota bacterium]|nr:beta-galactosidase [Armatimonadota bacterium]